VRLLSYNNVVCTLAGLAALAAACTNNPHRTVASRSPSPPGTTASATRSAPITTRSGATALSMHSTSTHSSTRRPSSTPTQPKATASARPTSSGTSARATPTPTQASTPPVVSGASINGCPLFPANNAWRTDISHYPLNRHSTAWVASAGASRFLHPDFGSDPTYGIPFTLVPASQPKVPITFTAYGDESDPGPYPIPPTARVEAGGDRHVLVASGYPNCRLYELYNAVRNGIGWDADSGAVFNLQSNALRPAGWTSADAAGLPILPGLVRYDEVAAGHIDHALRFTVSITQKGYISPARHYASSNTSPNVPPMGARFRLKSSYDITSFHGESLVILRCLKKYGMFVADNGSNWYISGATDSRWNDDDLNQLKTLPGSAFEVVDTGPVVTG